MAKGLLCGIYRNPLADCTNGGVTSSARGMANVTLVDDARIAPESLEVFEDRANAPAVYLRTWKGRMIAVPEPIPCAQTQGRQGEAFGLQGWMMGGNFIYTSDSRFPDDAPIRVYDRRED